MKVTMDLQELAVHHWIPATRLNMAQELAENGAEGQKQVVVQQGLVVKKSSSVQPPSSPARHWSPTPRRWRLPGEEAGIGRENRRDWKGFDNKFGRESIQGICRAGGISAREALARAVARRGAAGSQGMTQCALVGVSWSYRDICNWSHLISSP